MLVTDLDNTLYDWVTFFARAFHAMVGELSRLLDVSEDRLLDEFKTVHQRHGDTEPPFAALELPSVRQRFGDAPREELLRKLDRAFHSFNRARSEWLKLYDSVACTLSRLEAGGVVIVGYTEALWINACYRLRKLGIEHMFRRLYCAERDCPEHPDPSRGLRVAEDFVRLLPRSSRKPDPRVLLDICAQEGVAPGTTWYIGDSLTRDVAMAKAAGVKAIWARYGTLYDKDLWDIIVRVTHWTDQDVAREAGLRSLYSHLRPDYTVDSFRDILSIPGLGCQMPPGEDATGE